MRFRIAQSERACDPWRFVALPSRSTFWQLHMAVALELDEPASFPEFLLKHSPLGRRVFVGVPLDLVNGPVMDARKIRIRDHFRAPGDSANYYPRVSDTQAHIVILEAIALPEAVLANPRHRWSPIQNHIL